MKKYREIEIKEKAGERNKKKPYEAENRKRE